MARTQVAIVGAGPSGLLLSQLLHLDGIDSIVIERQAREYVAGRSFRVDLKAMTGDWVSVYGQTEVTKDLIEARTAAGAKLIYEASDVVIHAIDSAHPVVRYRRAGKLEEVQCDFIAGCDGYHGVCRPSVPPGALQTGCARRRPAMI